MPAVLVEVVLAAVSIVVAAVALLPDVVEPLADWRFTRNEFRSASRADAAVSRLLDVEVVEPLASVASEAEELGGGPGGGPSGGPNEAVRAVDELPEAESVLEALLDWLARSC